MSQEKANQFFELSKNDAVLQNRLKNINNSTELIQIASEKGYEFTQSEWQVAMQENVENDNLSEEDLLTIAAGLRQDDGPVIMADDVDVDS